MLSGGTNKNHSIPEKGEGKSTERCFHSIHRVQEISINYTSSRELFVRTTMVVNSCFSTMIADFLNDPNPKIMIECKQRLDSIKWKEAIEVELDSLRKRKVFSKVIPTRPRIHIVGFKWVSSGNGMRTMRL
jgi:hypothetical protein